ncbi:hypothetical protein [Nitrosospira sp. Nsp5]|nr:hypothetical protein [Nitrosospira sp. Nsp5]
MCFMMVGMSALADPVATSKPCTVKDRTEALVILVCAPNLDQETWQNAARAVCGSALMCNAWIWEDPAKAPVKAPATDSDIPKDQAAAAVAIWVHDSKSLISLRRVQ